MPCINRK